MSESTSPSYAEILRDIELKLRKPETDRAYLASQLVVLARIATMDVEREDGLASAALGGMLYCIERLREYWGKEGELPSLTYMRERYAEVELSRFAQSKSDIDNTVNELRRRNLLTRIAHVTGVDGKTYSAFLSALPQTTLDGRRLEANEMIDASNALVASFSEILRHEHEFKS